VPLAAVPHHLALPTFHSVCWSLALWVVADPGQLVAQALVLVEVLHGVVLAAVDRHSAPGTLGESAAGLEVRGARLARGEVASPGVLLKRKNILGPVAVEFLRV
jgi:hypothetical protein